LKALRSLTKTIRPLHHSLRLAVGCPAGSKRAQHELRPEFTLSHGGGIYNGYSALTLSNCTLSGNAASFGGGIFSYGVATLSSCTLSGNSASVSGGGIKGLATLTNCTLSGNTASGLGGGIYGGATLTNCTLSGNSASSGGGIYGLATLTNCTLSGNSAGFGGGICTDAYHAATLTNCTLSGNSASLGGGIKGTARLTNCTLSGNSASRGGGIFSDAYLAARLTNCTMSGNTAGIGGAIYNYDRGGTLALTNCTLSGNAASVSGGGIFNILYGTMTLNNTIVANSPTGGDVYNDGTVSGSHNLIGTAVTGSGANALTGTIVADPLLGPLQDNGGPTLTMALLAGSPALDAGDNTVAAATDQRGLPRIVNGTIDIGAFELQNSSPTAAAGGPYVISEGNGLALAASASDPENDPLSYSWDVNGDGIFGDATGPTPTLTWAQLQALGIDDGPKAFTVRVRVDDGYGPSHTVTAATTLTLDNTAPRPSCRGRPTASATSRGPSPSAPPTRRRPTWPPTSPSTSPGATATSRASPAPLAPWPRTPTRPRAPIPSP
jgi:parallel beta-helix repeat protein